MMDKLWAPWRITYVQSESDPGCIFCEKPSQDTDEENLIVDRNEHAFSMLNAYPYNNGHIMVIPYRHIAELENLTKEETLSMMSLVNISIGKLKKHLKPQGFNVGINLGKIAGAGIDQHVHMHIVPRWNGDTNFMPVVSETKIISQSLKELYKVLKS